MHKLTLKAAKEITGGLGKPSKMPGFAFGISANECKTGGRLQDVAGSVCFGCYALNANYQYPSVKTAHERRLAGIHKALSNPEAREAWLAAMAKLIGDQKYFRWHDSGDLQSLRHFELLVDVARACPGTRFWLPTKEPRFLKRFQRLGGELPANLLVRVSAPMVDQTITGFEHMSAVHTDEPAPGVTVCEAYTRKNVCGDCRACWDSSVKTISYRQH